MTPDVYLAETALASDEALADAMLWKQSKTPVREQHMWLARAIHSIRLAERQRITLENRGLLLAQTGEIFDALHSPQLIEGESVWQVR